MDACNACGVYSHYNGGADKQKDGCMKWWWFGRTLGCGALELIQNDEWVSKWYVKVVTVSK